MKVSTIAIAGLVLMNLTTMAALIREEWQPRESYVDHLEDLRLSKSDGNLHARLGDSRSRSSVTLVFTPHGAIQFHQELGRMFTLIEKKAGATAKGPPAAPKSPDPSL